MSKPNNAMEMEAERVRFISETWTISLLWCEEEKQTQPRDELCTSKHPLGTGATEKELRLPQSRPPQPRPPVQPRDQPRTGSSGPSPEGPGIGASRAPWYLSRASAPSRPAGPGTRCRRLRSADTPRRMRPSTPPQPPRHRSRAPGAAPSPEGPEAAPGPSPARRSLSAIFPEPGHRRHPSPLTSGHAEAAGGHL